MPLCGGPIWRNLSRMASTYPSRERFLTELTLDPPGATSDEAGAPHVDEDYLILSTIHSQRSRMDLGIRSQPGRRLIPSTLQPAPRPRSKGTAAALCGNDPRQGQPSSDRPQRFYVHQQANRGDRHLYATRTRFIPAATLGLFESRSWPAADSTPGAVQRGPATRIDIGVRLRRMWR